VGGGVKGDIDMEGGKVVGIRVEVSLGARDMVREGGIYT
jgi:hypothetical protein